jgi:deoxyribodipyrimidine photo-lyase
MPHEAHPHLPVILWFRRDLRLADNPALEKALSTGAPVISLYIREPDDPQAGANGAAQAWWQHHSLTTLDVDLRTRGNRLLLLTGDPRHLIEWLIEKTGAQAVFWNRRYDCEGRETDTEIKAELHKNGIRAESFSGFLMHDPAVLQTKQGKRYAVYTPFWKAFSASYEPPSPIPAPESVPTAEYNIESESLEDWHLLPTKPDWAEGFADLWQPGEAGALKCLADFVANQLQDYGHRRDFPATPATSRLSPHLAFGEISPHALWRAAIGSRSPAADIERFRKEIVWREFAWHVYFHNPGMADTNLDRRFDRFGWKQAPQKLEAWQRGMTGYPIVDAGMRELWQAGTMHNRVRMIVASFLIKDLLIDWREGERWFRDTLLDADRASNAFNWQWVAGCGADAAPFFRIFNPVRQGETFDPDGAYVRRWCPELGKLPDRWIHKPFEAPKEILAEAGITLGKTYPHPMVDHAEARDAALAAFRATRQNREDD